MSTITVSVRSTPGTDLAWGDDGSQRNWSGGFIGAQFVATSTNVDSTLLDWGVGSYLNPNSNNAIGVERRGNFGFDFTETGGGVKLHFPGWQYVFELVGDVSWLDGEGSASLTTRYVAGPNYYNISFTTSFDWMATLRGRLGYATNDVLLYGTVGLALTDNEQVSSGDWQEGDKCCYPDRSPACRIARMYLPPHFQEIRPDEITAVIDAAPLACIVAQTTEGLIANHIPLLQAPDGVLIGHVALANDMHRLIPDGQEVLIIFRGEDGYVSPNYYPSKTEHHRHVPTWNYQVVHVYGSIQFQYDEHAKRAAVGLLTRSHERRLNGKDAWRMADAPADYMEQMLSNIVAFRIKVERTLAKSKLSQNREERDYLGAIAGLRASGHEGLAERMEQRLSQTE